MSKNTDRKCNMKENEFRISHIGNASSCQDQVGGVDGWARMLWLWRTLRRNLRWPPHYSAVLLGGGPPALCLAAHFDPMASSVSRPSETISSPLPVEHKYLKQQPCPFAGLLLLLLGLNNCACLHTPHNYIPELCRLVCLLCANWRWKSEETVFLKRKFPVAKLRSSWCWIQCRTTLKTNSDSSL